MSYINPWIIASPALTASFYERLNETGSLDDQTFAILNTMVDPKVVQGLYEQPNGFSLFSLRFATDQEANDAITYLDATWGAEVVTDGSWQTQDLGLQQGLTPIVEVDDDGQTRLIGIEGTPTYPIPPDAYELMPPIIEYDENGDPISSTPATDNDDLRDISLVFGDLPRRFPTINAVTNNGLDVTDNGVVVTNG
jgi:hypothetical protein